MRRGVTLAELTVVLSIMGLMAGFAIPRFLAFRDAAAVDAAATSAVALLSVARHAAIRRSAITAISFDTSSATITVFAGPDTIERRPLGAIHGVRMAVTRDSIAYTPGGKGYGAANTRAILSRGAAADTVTVSRLGRVRR
jgi:prepilin-type N-terminal cleavage/methylation domain-containing protein